MLLLATLDFQFVEQLQSLVIIPGLEEFTDLVEVGVDEEKLIGFRAISSFRLLLEVLPECIAVGRIINVFADHAHQQAGIAVTVYVGEADITICGQVCRLAGTWFAGCACYSVAAASRQW